MDIRECYNIFDLPFGAPLQKVEKTYKQLARVWHPDRFGKSPDLQRAAQEKLKRINQAYDMLKVYLADGGEDASEGSTSSANDKAAPYGDSCKYLGGDVRLEPISIVEIAGRDALVEVSTDGIAIVTRSSTGPEEAALYLADSIVWLRRGTKSWYKPEEMQLQMRPGLSENALPSRQVRFNAADPEGILSDGFIVQLKFSNDYYTELFVKRMISNLGLVENKAQTSKPVEPGIQGGYVVLAVLSIIIVLLVAKMLSPRQLTTRQSTSTKQASTNHPPAVPAHAISKGNFTAWSDPARPQRGQDYVIIIRFNLPKGMDHIPIEDLSGPIVTDRRSPYPLTRLLSEKANQRPYAVHMRSENAKLVPVTPKGYLPVIDQTADLQISVPQSNPIRRITIRSHSLSEEATFAFELESSTSGL